MCLVYVYFKATYALHTYVISWWQGANLKRLPMAKDEHQ